MVQNGSNCVEADQQFIEQVYEQLWTIPDWNRINRSQDALNAESFEFKTSKSNRLETTWKTSFRFGAHAGYFRLYCQLIDTKNFPDGKVETSTNCSLLNADSTVYRAASRKKIFNIGNDVDVSDDFNFDANWGSIINGNGEVVFKLQLTIMEPKNLPVDLKTELFRKACIEQLSVNLANLLGEKETTDLKIITSDGKELLAHKIILKAQCPVFESMFRSQMSESQTGVVNVKDVSAKTMGIFLHLFYSGELLSSWKDPDTVVEFTYAVGKYQLTNVQKFLDDVLGTRDEEDATHTDVQLLDLAQKLDLKNVEMELLERIRKKIIKVKSGAEFFTLCGVGRIE